MTTLITAEMLSNAIVEREELEDGTIVYVARDLSWDGCLAQAPSREEALAALEDARRDYAAVLGELHQRVPARTVQVPVSGWVDRLPGSSHTLVA